MRQVERDHLDIREGVAQRGDPRRARAIAVADEQRVVVEPDGVAAFDGGGRRHLRGDRDARGLEARADAPGSPRRPSLPGRRSAAPPSPTSTGS